MKISVIGLGYIGLPTAAILASKGNEVVGIDVDNYIVDTINKGDVHIVEPELDIIVNAAVNVGKLRASLVHEEADVFIITVPTPFNDKFKPDLSCVESAVRAIAPVLGKGNLIIVESTSPVGTMDLISKWLQEERKDLLFPEYNAKDLESDVYLSYCPERVLPGHIFRELVENDRVIGGMTIACAKKAKEVYDIFVEGECVLTNTRTAEMCKLSENAFRDVNIAFANELANISDQLDIDVWELIKLSNRHPRVNILQPGPGVGGHCIAVDPWFIVNSAPEQAKLIRSAREVNDARPEMIVKKIEKAVEKTGKNEKELSIASFGLSFKADIDDLRSSPAVEIAKSISTMQFKNHYIVEPNLNKLPASLNFSCNVLECIEEAIVLADIIVLLVNHTPFKSIDVGSLIGSLKGKQIIDTRGIWGRG